MPADDPDTSRDEPAEPRGGGTTSASPPSRAPIPTGAPAKAPAPAAAAAGRAFRRRPTSLGDAFRFFLPLMLMAELMMISHAVISAFLARMTDPEPVLAAYSIAFYFHATIGSPIWACQFVAVSFIRDRASMRRLLFFSLQVAAFVSLVLFTVGLTPVGAWLFRTLFGAGPEVADAAQRCTFIFSFVMLFAVVRSLVYGLFMVERKTIYVTLGTVVRLAGLAVVLAGLTLFIEGAEVGAIALVACIAIETVFGVIVARPFFRRLPAGRHPPSYRELWKFSWPIMIMQTAESGVIFTINLFLGRLVRPELALAAFGLLDSLMRLLLSPLRNVIQTVQALVRFRRDVGVILTFATIVGSGFAGMTLLFHFEGGADLRAREGHGAAAAHGGVRGARVGIRLPPRARDGGRFPRARAPHRGQADRGDRDRLRGATPHGGSGRGSGHPPRDDERRPHRDVRPHRRIPRRVGSAPRPPPLDRPDPRATPPPPTARAPQNRHRRRRVAPVCIVPTEGDAARMLELQERPPRPNGSGWLHSPTTETKDPMEGTTLLTERTEWTTFGRRSDYGCNPS